MRNRSISRAKLRSVVTEWDAGIRLGQHRLDLRFDLEVYARCMVTVALRDQAAHLTALMYQQPPAEIYRTLGDQPEAFSSPSRANRQASTSRRS